MQGQTEISQCKIKPIKRLISKEKKQNDKNVKCVLLNKKFFIVCDGQYDTLNVYKNMQTHHLDQVFK